MVVNTFITGHKIKELKIILPNKLH
jgi:hypothetical protein